MLWHVKNIHCHINEISQAKKVDLSIVTSVAMYEALSLQSSTQVASCCQLSWQTWTQSQICIKEYFTKFQIPIEMTWFWLKIHKTMVNVTKHYT